MEKIPTAINHVIKDLEMLRDEEWVPDESSIMSSIEMLKEAKVERIEFAKMHVEAALKAAKERYLYDELNISEDPVFLASSIMDSYPLTNIK